jgi:hypothetical protein
MNQRVVVGLLSCSLLVVTYWLYNIAVDRYAHKITVPHFTFDAMSTKMKTRDLEFKCRTAFHPTPPPKTCNATAAAHWVERLKPWVGDLAPAIDVAKIETGEYDCFWSIDNATFVVELPFNGGSRAVCFAERGKELEIY